ncbi:MAG: MFS transporter [Actinomycetia bacterium]|nr:MFS transporter [Actinomycetes bacterium]
MSAVPGRPASSFRVPGYRYLWITGWLWHVARWMAIFATTFRVNEQTGDPLLVQLVGASFMAPMFLGGALAGTITDRLDRHRTVARALGFLIPLSGLMGLAVAADQAPVGVSYLFVFCVGVGNVLDMTCRRTIAFGLVGAGLITNAGALETFALHAGNMVGSLGGGAIIDAFDAAWVYAMVGLVYAAATGSFARAGRVAGRDQPPRASTASTTVGDDLRAALGLVRRHAVLRQFLMTTVLMNFFYYAFMPLVPVFAEDLGVGAFETGLLASALGAGTMTGALVVARIEPRRPGRLHVVGSLGAMIMLIVFANLTWYPAALGSLFVAGLSGSGFGTTQAALVVSLVDESLRGRALGVLSMAIGALPFGMFSLGLIAQRTDPQQALTLSVGVGIVLHLGWQATHPHLGTLR